MLRTVVHVAAPIAAIVFSATLGTGCSAPPAVRTGAPPPRVYALNGAELVRLRERVRADDPALRLAVAKLIDEADAAARAAPVAVTQKSTLLPPSGDAHDYFSLSPYWWPDPAKPDGLPYIRRDGETNPESKRDLDQPRVARLGANLQTLALAWFYTGREAYAAAAATQLKTWFLDPATKMNPHLRYAQLVRGIDRERGSGIIDTRWFIEVVDAVGLIEGSASWQESDTRALQEWFRAYLDWLRTSPNGEHERKAVNNHGSWFAAQTVSYALFVGDQGHARTVLEGIKDRIGAQILPDGSQPIELQRTRSMHYENFNVEALSRLAEMGRHLDVDLWRYQAPGGGSIARAVDRIAPYVHDQKAWPGTQLDPVELNLLLLTLRRTQAALGPRAAWTKAIRDMPDSLRLADRSALLYRDPAL